MTISYGSRRFIRLGKILLVGNGLTSNLIPEYHNEEMMTKIKTQAPELFQKANECFAPFRKKVDRIQYAAVAEGFCGDDVFCGESGFDDTITDLPYNNELLHHIEKQLLLKGFDKSILDLHFQTYGLIYETQFDEISNVESLLKIIDLFSKIGLFSAQDKKGVEALANRVYFNDGNCGNQSIDNRVKTNLFNWLSTYDKIFTTNYDSLLDDTLSTDQVKHLHGGFHYADKYARSASIVPPDQAYLIWGISGEEKAQKMQGGFSFPIVIPFASPISVFEEYLSELKNVQADRIDIFGYSGENDQHINTAISQNAAIREVHYFCNPKRVHDAAEEFSVKSRFQIGENKKLVLESWDIVWNQLYGKSDVELCHSAPPE